MEKLYFYLPTILSVASLAGLVWVYMYIIKRYLKDKLSSVEYVTKNQFWLSWIYATPAIALFAPLVEELIFRMPLILLFDTNSAGKQWAIIGSSLIFGCIHLYGNKITMLDFIGREPKSDDLKTEINEIVIENSGWKILARKIWNAVATFGLGIALAHYAIESQSIWVAIGIHAAWNLFMPILIMLAVVIVIAVFVIGNSLWNKFVEKGF
jgi:membrane protease YdiL (CAAX protease family)